LFSHDSRAPDIMLNKKKGRSAKGPRVTHTSDGDTIEFSFTTADSHPVDRTMSAATAMDELVRESKNCTLTLHHRTVSLDFPALTKFVAMAAYLCSHIPESENERLFSPRHHKGKNKSSSRKRKYVLACARIDNICQRTKLILFRFV